VLSSSDADLCLRDPALTGLATLLDPEAFVAALRRERPEFEVSAARIGYIRYKPGTSCLVAYQVEVGGATVDLSAHALRSDEADKLRKAREQPGVPGPLGPGRFTLDPHAIAVSVFPNDAELEVLARLVDPREWARLLRRFFPDRPDFWEGRTQGLVYKPERRYVARLLVDGVPRAALKFYTEADFRAVRANARAFRSRGPLRLAARLGRSRRHRVLTFEWVSGRPLNEVLTDPGLGCGALEAVGAALAELHDQEAKRLALLTREAEAAALLGAAVDVALVCPHLGRRADDLARRLAARLMEEASPGRPTHGDFHARQILLTGDGVTVLDLDRAIRADPRKDLGLFVANLEREVIRGELSPDRVEPLMQAVFEGYRATTRRPAPTRVELHIAAELFRLSPRFFRYCEPDWPDRTEASLERTEEILKRSS